MKILKFLFLLMLLPVFASSVFAQEISLAKALKQGLVEAEFISNGNYYGEVVTANIISKVDRDLQLVIDIGNTLAVDCPGRPACGNVGKLKRTVHKEFDANEPYVLRVGQPKQDSLYELCLAGGKKSTIEGWNINKDFFTVDALPRNTQEIPAEFLAGQAAFNPATNCFEYSSADASLAPVVALQSTEEYGYVSDKDVEKICMTNLGNGIRTCAELNERNFWSSQYLIGSAAIFLYETTPQEGCEYFQDLVVSKKTVIPLAAGSSAQIKVEGFCMEANDDAPAINVKFRLCDAVDKSLYSLLNEIDRKGLASEEGAQFAVWKITDNANPADFGPKPEYYNNDIEAYNAELAKFNAKVQLSDSLLSSAKQNPPEVQSTKDAAQDSSQDGSASSMTEDNGPSTLWLVLGVIAGVAIIVITVVMIRKEEN